MPQTTFSPDARKEKALLTDEILFQAYGGPFLFFSDKDPLSELISSMLSHRTKNQLTGQGKRIKIRSFFRDKSQT